MPLKTFLLVALPMATTAFSSIPVNLPYPIPNNGKEVIPNNKISKDQEYSLSQSQGTTLSSAPWRIVLDIGREPLSRMPFDWARSGCRMPLAIPCDVSRSFQSDDEEEKLLVAPQSDTVSFTGPGGAVVKPVIGGEWEISDDQKQVSFSLSFPETMERRDVTIGGGTTLELIGRMYTQAELDQLNDAYYQAREHTWQVGGDLNEMVRQQGAAKRWNEATGRWEKPQIDGNIISTLQKRMNYWAAKAKQDEMNRQRPDANSISSRGMLPGMDGGVYIAKGGIVRQSNNGPVMGTWQAEPITKNPTSYRS